VKPDDEIMLISSGGTLVRTQVSEISVQGRNTQGVRLIRVDEGERLVGLERIVVEAGAEGGPENGEGAPENGEGGEAAEGDENGAPAE
jgi:DNA gyrase subunit A